MSLDAMSPSPAPAPWPRDEDADAETMLAMSFSRFGGDDVLAAAELPIPRPGPGQVLVRVLAAGVGHWDVLEREGVFAARSGQPLLVPHVPGAEGAGTVVEVGAGVHDFREGDRVCGLVPLRNPRCGFHAQFVVLDADHVWPVPSRLSLPQAAAMPVDAALAMQGIDAALMVGKGDALLVLGASGGIGHMALQFARQRGARVLAVASGADGQALCERLGADMAIDGRRHNLAAALRIFAPDGLDAALLTAEGPLTATIVDALRPGGRVAWPHGVADPPARGDIAAVAFGMRHDAQTMRAVRRAIDAGPFHLHVSRRFPLQRLAEAQQAVTAHHLGRIVLDVP
ncbi:NADP-dependent oxidoreductase [Luteimonas sp. BDR2-5]|uniref:NADP-dependent oxidoreductase n=1 Tax=Proluteimonas luteida TaxID=2878685 RepID=UPI001E5C73E3|nr:NADP-dependent oxidoreductase [Luteimonas sp. BDR2-5]MCD9028280.1 NADP-dependent oxidoreductase [Luteimonas sp. BDR2-5]